MGAITPLAIDNTTVEVKSSDLINQGKSIAGSLAAWTLNERSKRNGGERVDSLIKRLVGGRTLREAEKGQLSAQTLLGLSLYLARGKLRHPLISEISNDINSVFTTRRVFKTNRHAH